MEVNRKAYQEKIRHEERLCEEADLIPMRQETFDQWKAWQKELTEEELQRTIVKGLKQHPVWKLIDGRSKLKKKAEIINAILSTINRHVENAVVGRMRHICDRQNLLQTTLVRRAGLDAYMMDRIDMYWVEIGEDTYYVEPCSYFKGASKWYISRCASKTEKYVRGREFAEAIFRGSKEEENQRRWMQNLFDGGYFEDGRYPGVDTYCCERCGRTYKNGSTHEHKMFNGRVVTHSYRQYQKILEAGLTVIWRPGCGDSPSLEEQEAAAKNDDIEAESYK